jgi:hypothetical protein
MHEELRKEIIRLLNAAPIHSVGTPPVDVVFHDHVPQDSTFPYGVLGDATSAGEDTDTAEGALVRFPISCFSKYKGGRETAAMADAVRAALHHQEDLMVLTTCTAVTMFVEGSQEDPTTDDGKARESVVTVSIRVYAITAGTA